MKGLQLLLLVLKVSSLSTLFLRMIGDAVDIFLEFSGWVETMASGPKKRLNNSWIMWIVEDHFAKDYPRSGEDLVVE